MPWYPRIQVAIKRVLPLLLPTQATNLALLVSALLAKRSSCLSELARAYPRPHPEQRRVPAPKHDLLHRVKRLWHFLDNPRIDAQALQLVLIPATIAGLGYPCLLGLAIDWTFFDSALPSGRRMRYQVLRIAVPRRGRALPLLQLAYNRDDLPAGQSQNQLEETALLAVVQALPTRVRITAGTGLVAADGPRSRLGTEGLRPGEIRWAPNVRYGQRYQGRPRDLWVNVAFCWRLPRHVQRTLHQTRANEPWYLATNQPSAQQAVAWYRQRFWIEIVCMQMTKTDVLASRRRRNHIADLNIAVRDNHAIDEQFNQLAFLLERGVVEAALEALAEGCDGQREPSQV